MQAFFLEMFLPMNTGSTTEKLAYGRPLNLLKCWDRITNGKKKTRNTMKKQGKLRKEKKRQPMKKKKIELDFIYVLSSKLPGLHSMSNKY